MIASAFVAAVGDPAVFKSGRNLAAWIGLAPKQNSSAGKERLGGFTKAKAAPVYKRTGNLRAVHILLGHTKIETTVRYLGVDIEDALVLSEATDLWPDRARLGCEARAVWSSHVAGLPPAPSGGGRALICHWTKGIMSEAKARMMAPLVGSQNPNPARVLGVAVNHITGLWQLSNVELGAIIRLSAPTVARLRADRFKLQPGSTPFELAQHLLRLFRPLDS